MCMQVALWVCAIVRGTFRLTACLALRLTVRALICSAAGAAADPAPDERPATAYPDLYARALAIGQCMLGALRACSAIFPRELCVAPHARHACYLYYINSSIYGRAREAYQTPEDSLRSTAFEVRGNARNGGGLPFILKRKVAYQHPYPLFTNW